MLFLWDSSYRETSREIKLMFLESKKGEIIDFSVDSYMPYFLAPYPLSKEEREAVESFQGKVETVKKRNLFTDRVSSMAKVKVSSPLFLKSLRGHFKQVWESEIDYGRSYIYDNGLVFGAPCIQQGGLFTITTDIDKNLKRKFKKTFGMGEGHGSHARKHKQIEEWFNLCNQEVPEISLDVLDSSGKSSPTGIYSAFLLARLANIPVQEAFTSRRVSDWIRSVIYDYMRKNSILIPTSEEMRRGFETRKVPGALTITPAAGIYFNTVVCDFESLYPSCIDSYNLSYETVDCPHEECEANRIQETNHHTCTKRKGFYSILMGALKDLRIHWFKPLSNTALSSEARNRARAASRMLKLLSVSGYGVTVRIHGLACPPLAESITGYGRRALQMTFKIAEECGLHPIYGDTDSIFLDNPSPSQVHVLATKVKNHLKLELAVEKHYSICVLPRAKKAYFGITKDGEPDLKGLTAIKSNAPSFIQKVFRRCVGILSDVENMEQYILAKRRIVEVVRQQKKRLLEGKVGLEKLIYSVQLYHNPEERIKGTKVMPQPYQCAMQMIDGGERLRRRDIVRFLKVKPFSYKGKIFTVKPFHNVRSLSEVNTEDYIRNLTTALKQTFEPMGIKLNADTNKKLTNWFGN